MKPNNWHSKEVNEKSGNTSLTQSFLMLTTHLTLKVHTSQISELHLQRTRDTLQSRIVKTLTRVNI
jgi:hypothetical protein